MNKDRRKRIQAALDKLEDVKGELEEIWDEEQEAYENLPESLQFSEKGESMSEVLTVFENAQASLEEAIDGLTEVIE